MLPECARTGVGFLPYFPLANGLLTGKYRKGEPFPDSSRAKDAFGPKVFTAANLERAEALTAFARSRRRSLLELAFSWLAARPQVSSVIAGAKTPEQVRANSAAASWKLTAADLAELDKNHHREIHPPRRRQGERPFFTFRAGPRSRGAKGRSPGEAFRLLRSAFASHRACPPRWGNPLQRVEPGFDGFFLSPDRFRPQMRTAREGASGGAAHSPHAGNTPSNSNEFRR